MCIPRFPTLVLTVCFLLAGNARAQVIEATSPDGRLVFALGIRDLEAESEVPLFRIQHDGQPVVLAGRLGPQMGDSNGEIVRSWANGVRILGTLVSESDTVWTPVYGERKQIRDNYRELRIDMTQVEDSTRLMALQVRVYDHGVAFRYHWPEGANNQILVVVEEETSFALPEGTKAWYTPQAQTPYIRRDVNNWSRPSEMPLTLELPEGKFAALAEAGMVNYSRARLETSREWNTLEVSLFGKVIETSPFSSPWRVVMVAETEGDLLAGNDLILNLNAPNRIGDASWIRPGKAIREMTLSTDGAEKLVDFASSNGLDYVHFDAGWYGHEYLVAADATTVTVDPQRNPQGDLDLQEAIRYAKSKGLGVFVYVNHRALERQLDRILPLYKSWGIDGIKFGFVHVGSHRWTTWLYDAVEKAAEHQLLVNVHDEFRPTGASRTFPNLMTQEGIRGNEEMPDATHNTVLPFTRFLAGAADYTPAYYYRQEFGHPDRHIRTTPAHQLALPVIFYSPVQWLYWYDVPSRDSQGEPELAFWAHCPTTWDDTRVLQGRIGESVAVARRSGEEWYVGVITNNYARNLEVSLDFLKPGNTYVASRYADGGPEIPTRTHVKIDSGLVNASTVLSFELKQSGGAALRIVPATVDDLGRYLTLR